MEVYQHPILQGWLEKEKRSSSLLSSLRTKRWFTIEKAGTDFSDITLSYYKSPRANPVDRCGWIFLSDCTSLDEYAESSKVTALSNTDSRRKSITSKEEGPRVIIIHHPSRKFQLRAQDRYEHHLWFDALKKHCINAISKEEQEEKEENEQQDLTPKSLEKLKAAGAFHFSNKTPPESERNISAELSFMRSINADEHAVTTAKFDSQENDMNESKIRQEDEDDVNAGGKLVDDEDLDRYLQAVTGDVGGGRDDEMEIRIQGSFDEYASTEKELSNMTENVAHTTFQSERDNQEAYHYADSEHGRKSNLAFDHRIQNSSYNGNETIQKRLHRAILPSGDDFELERYENQSSPSLSLHSNDEVVTMVKRFAFDSDSDEDSTNSPLPVPVRVVSHARNEHEWHDIDDSNLCKGEDASINSFGSTGQKHDIVNSQQDKQTEESNPSERSLKSSKVPDKKHSISFDSDCSYLPDDDFATANWDSD